MSGYSWQEFSQHERKRSRRSRAEERCPGASSPEAIVVADHRLAELAWFENLDDDRIGCTEHEIAATSAETADGIGKMKARGGHASVELVDADDLHAQMMDSVLALAARKLVVEMQGTDADLDEN